jgi:hypothetical protein
VAARWLSCSCGCFLPPWESQDTCTRCRVIIFSWLEKITGTFAVSNRILRDIDTDLLKPIKTGLSRESRDESEPFLGCVRGLFSRRYVPKSQVEFVSSTSKLQSTSKHPPPPPVRSVSISQQLRDHDACRLLLSSCCAGSQNCPNYHCHLVLLWQHKF